MEDDIDIDGMADVYGDLNDFEKRLKKGPNAMNYEENSSDDEKVIDRKNPLALAEEKIRMLMDRLFKSEKELNDMKETYESIIGSSESLKDKKIIDFGCGKTHIKFTSHINHFFFPRKLNKPKSLTTKVFLQLPRVPLHVTPFRSLQ